MIPGMSIAFLLVLLQKIAEIFVYYPFVKISRNCTYTRLRKLQEVHNELTCHRYQRTLVLMTSYLVISS